MGNDGAFINETLIKYCADRGIEFTRSRAYRSNDQAWIEQKNGSVVRRFVGHDRDSNGEIHCLSTTRDGHPRHHLYVPSATKLSLFRPAQ